MFNKEGIIKEIRRVIKDDELRAALYAIVYGHRADRNFREGVYHENKYYTITYTVLGDGGSYRLDIWS